ncbi:hypothetical protein TNCV_4720101 [Trichonephila clavipes]|uniref:Uncharacterized protein n=1 Tax=Trichonephila clavipes TaxID=2585209 RepID=A0A8X7BF16_TRICX|nr:hypothetical protein TNCV_4720101 [Trichonephila clavipes]
MQDDHSIRCVIAGVSDLSDISYSDLPDVAGVSDLSDISYSDLPDADFGSLPGFGASGEGNGRGSGE